MSDPRQLLLSYFNDKYSGSLTGSTNLFQVGALDSLGVVELVAFLEDTFPLTVEADDMVEENFSTLQAILELITRKSS